MKYNPPINERDNDELIAIANNSGEYWQEDAIEQAKKEIIKRGISKEFQVKLLTSWEKEYKKSQNEYEAELKENELESYQTWTLIALFLFAPLYITGKLETELNFYELKLYNFKKKIRQKRIMLLSGILTWVIFLYFIITYHLL